jgi:hypothetical protein
VYICILCMVCHEDCGGCVNYLSNMRGLLFFIFHWHVEVGESFHNWTSLWCHNFAWPHKNVTSVVE